MGSWHQICRIGRVSGIWAELDHMISRISIVLTELCRIVIGIPWIKVGARQHDTSCAHQHRLTHTRCNGHCKSLVNGHCIAPSITEMILINQNGMRVSILINMQSQDDHHYQGQCHEKTSSLFAMLKIW